MLIYLKLGLAARTIAITASSIMQIVQQIFGLVAIASCSLHEEFRELDVSTPAIHGRFQRELEHARSIQQSISFCSNACSNRTLHIVTPAHSLNHLVLKIIMAGKFVCSFVDLYRLRQFEDIPSASDTQCWEDQTFIQRPTLQSYWSRSSAFPKL